MYMCIYMYMYIYMCIYMYMYIQLTALGVLCCFTFFALLFDFACFFFPSFSFLIKTCIHHVHVHVYTSMYTYVHVCIIKLCYLLPVCVSQMLLSILCVLLSPPPASPCAPLRRRNPHRISLSPTVTCTPPSTVSVYMLGCAVLLCLNCCLFDPCFFLPFLSLQKCT